MREETKKLVKVFEEEERRFDLIDGEKEDRDFDSVYLSFRGELKDNEIGLHIYDSFITISSMVINTVKEEKYDVLVDVLNTLNADYSAVKFYAYKDDERDREYCVYAQIDVFYDEKYDPEKIFELVDLMLFILNETYPVIIKAIV